MNRTRSRAVRALATLIGIAMAGGGAMKLLGQPGQVAAFAAWGLPPWFRVLVGTFEVLGAALLIVPATTPVGGAILSTIMVGAAWVHAVYREWPHEAPVVVLLALLLTIVRLDRTQALRLLGGA